MATLLQTGKQHHAAVVRDFADGSLEHSAANATAGNTATPTTDTTGSPQTCPHVVTEYQIARLMALNEECKQMIVAERERLAQCKAKLEAILDAYHGMQ